MQVQPEWIAMFNEEELQTLISGRMEEGLDVADMQAHTNYAGASRSGVGCGFGGRCSWSCSWSCGFWDRCSWSCDGPYGCTLISRFK